MPNIPLTERFRRRLRNWLLQGEDRFERVTFPHLRGAVLELNNLGELKKAFGWEKDPILQDPIIHNYDYIEDANERRIRDAEVLGVIAKNIDPAICLEIGTAEGHGTALIADNAPEAIIYTVNIPPEEVLAGEGGVHTTIALEKEEIGIYFRKKGLKKITQIHANTTRWTPDFGPIDLAFIDGCHDVEFVHNDTRKILPQMRPGGFIVWHDFNPALIGRFAWIHDVCTGVEKLFADGLIRGQILHLRDSWMGVYRVPDAEGGIPS